MVEQFEIRRYNMNQPHVYLSITSQRGRREVVCGQLHIFIYVYFSARVYRAQTLRHHGSVTTGPTQKTLLITLYFTYSTPKKSYPAHTTHSHLSTTDQPHRLQGLTNIGTR